MFVMSVHQESLDMNKSVERMEQAPELEYRAVSHDSLSMFLAAIGGAVLGMLLTLLILALINGGTLSFTGGERLTVFEEKLNAVDNNVNAVSHNVDTVSQQAQAVVSQLNTVESALRAEMATQGANLGTLDQAVTQLDRTRQQFDLFMGALSEAMSSIQQMDTSTTAEPARAAAVVEPVTAPVTLPAPSVTSSPEVTAGAVAVVLFVDANANGALDEGEAQVPGASVSVLDAEDKAIASAESTDTGVLFSDLAAGEYKFSVEDAAGYTLLSQAQVDVTIAEDAEEGQLIYVPVASE
jgi:hypothetical protein